MAGDWIKLEAATRRKPEILLAADLLGIKRREAIGLFVDYFCWIDENINDELLGLVPNVSRSVVDSVFDCPGFAAVLETIGWVYFNDEERILTVRHWDYHFGKAAKSRALEQKKKQRQRSKSVPILSRSCPDATGPEKRREELLTTKALPPEPVDNSVPVDNSWAGHWTAKGKSLGINANPGESTGDYCRRVMRAVKGE